MTVGVEQEGVEMGINGLDLADELFLCDFLLAVNDGSSTVIPSASDHASLCSLHGWPG
jgi:hypothetical protein